MENPEINTVQKELEEKKVDQVKDSGLEEYSNFDYWDNRFKQARGLFDWYADYSQIKQIMDNMGLSKSDRILMVGCGNSKLSEQMYDDGFTNIVNTDISPACIEHMKKHYENSEKKMEWMVMDATDLKFEDQSFELVIDKGTIDALVCGTHVDATLKLLREMSRVTKVGHQFLVITYMGPEGRKLFWEDSIPTDKYITFFAKCNLCDKSDLINIMRANLGDKPMSEMFKDKKNLVKAMMEFKEAQEIKMKAEKEDQKIYRLKYDNFIMNWGDRLKDKSLMSQAKGAETKEVGDIDIVPQISKFEKKNDEVQEKNAIGNPSAVRQNHCFIYVSKKIA